MAYNTRAIKTDLNNRPIPQYFNPVVDDYEALRGENGASRVLLYDGNGQPLLTETNPGHVTLSGSNVPLRLAPGGYEGVTYMRAGPIGAGVMEVLVNRPGEETELESLQMGTNYFGMRLVVSPYTADGSLSGPLQIMRYDGTSAQRIQPNFVQTHGNGENDFFRNFIYDEQNNHFTLGMKRQARFPGGIRITVDNLSSEEKSVAVQAMIAVFK